MKKFILFLVAVLFSMSYCMAAPPFISTSSNTVGFSIEPVLVDCIKTGETYEFNIHVFNQTSGHQVTDNSKVTCYMHLYNRSGAHIYDGYSDVVTHTFDWEFIVNGANFTNGFYQAKFQCNTTNVGGAAEITFEVNPFGVAFTLERSILYIIYIVIAILLFAGFLILGVALPSKNNTDEVTGYIIAVSNLKYLKMLFLAFAYLTLVCISYLLWVVSYSHLVGLEYMSSLLQYAFYALAFGTIIVFVVGIYISIANWIRDTKIADMLSRGLSTQ